MSDQEGVEEYIDTAMRKLQEHDLIAERIHNADETGLFGVVSPRRHSQLVMKYSQMRLS
jgi:hypothetical protein